MKSNILQILAIATLAFTSPVNAQTTNSTNADQSNVTIVSTNPDQGKHASVYMGLFGPEGENLIGASYYKPKSFYMNAMGGLTGGMVDGSFFFQSKMKESKLKQTVKSKTTTGYSINTPIDQRVSVGLHAGGSYVNYAASKINLANSFSTNGIFGGLTFLSSRYAHWKINGDKKELQGTTIGRINADVIYYTNRTLIPAQDAKDQLSIDKVSRKVGFRLYFDGKTSVWSTKGRVAIHYMAGIGRNSDKLKDIAPFAGVGIGYNFL